MPSFKGKISNNNQCIIDVFITGELVRGQNKDLNVGNRFVALIDTGAQKSSISSRVVQKLELTAQEKTEMNTASHVVSVNKLIKDPANFDFLLGMDILSQCTLFIAHGEYVVGI